MRGDTDILSLRLKYRQQTETNFNKQYDFTITKAIYRSKKVHPRGGVYKKVITLMMREEH